MSANTAPIFPSVPKSTVNNLYSANTNKDGSFATALFNTPTAQVIVGNKLYIADSNNHRIRTVDMDTGMTETYFGSGSNASIDGFGINASFNNPYGITTNGTDKLYVIENAGCRIRQIDLNSREVITLAGSGSSSSQDGIGISATIQSGVSITYLNGKLYFVQQAQHKLRVLDLTTLEVLTLAGSGNAGFKPGFGTNAQLNSPRYVTTDGTDLYITQVGTIVKYIVATGEVRPFSGNISQTSIFCDTDIGDQKIAMFNTPKGVTYDGTYVYVADTANHCIRKIDQTNNKTITLCGIGGTPGYVDGIASKVKFNQPRGLFYYSGFIYVADMGNNCIRKVSVADGSATTVAGISSAGYLDGDIASAQFASPVDICIDKTTNMAYVADQNNNVVRRIDLTNNVVSTIAGVVGTFGSTDSEKGLNATFSQLTSLALDETNQFLFVADASANKIRKIDLKSANFGVTTVAGTGSAGSYDGPVNAATFNYPSGIAFDGFEQLYVADVNNNKIRVIDLRSNTVFSVYGSGTAGSTDGIGVLATFFNPFDIFVSQDSKTAFVADTGNSKIRAINTLTKEVNLLAGAGIVSYGDGISIPYSASFGLVSATAYDGRYYYIADANTYKIKRYDPITNTIMLIAGNGNSNLTDGFGMAASFGVISHMEYDATSNCLYFSDTTNHAIRRLELNNNFFISTMAGDGNASYSDGAGYFMASEVNEPRGVCSDGTTVYFTDTKNNKIRKYDIATGVVSTIAGTGQFGSLNGAGTSATFNLPKGICLDQTNTKLFVADTGNNMIRQIDLSNNTVTTIAGSGDNSSLDGNGLSATFNYPQGITQLNGVLYVADTNSNKIRSLTYNSTLSQWVVATVAGTGLNAVSQLNQDNAGINRPQYNVDGNTGSAVSFFQPTGITCDDQYLYVADTGNQRIRKVNPLNGATTTLAGSPSGAIGGTDGTGLNASFYSPTDITCDKSGNILYVTDTGNNKIRKIMTQTGAVYTIAGSGSAGSTDNSTGTNGTLNGPLGLCVSPTADYIYVADTKSNKIRRVSTSGYALSTIVGTGNTGSMDGVGQYSQAILASPNFCYLDEANNAVYFTDGNKVRKLDNKTGIITSVAGSGASGFADGPAVGIQASFNSPYNVVVDSASKYMYVADTANNKIRRVELATGNTITFAGTGSSGFVNGEGLNASFNTPVALCFSKDFNTLYVTDSGNNAIRKIDVATARVETLDGGASGFVDGNSTAAKFNSPKQICLGQGPLSDSLLVADTGNNAIRRIVIATGQVSTYSGLTSGSSGNFQGYSSGTPASFNSHKGIAQYGSILYVADSSNHKIRKIDMSTGAVSTISGTGTSGFTDGTNGAGSAFNGPQGVAVTNDGNYLYVADTGNHAIRKVTIATGATTTVVGAAAPNATAGYADGSQGSSRLNGPTDVILTPDNSTMYICEAAGNRIRSAAINNSYSTSTIAGASGANVGTAGGADGAGSNATCNNPSGGCLGASGVFYFVDSGGYTVRKITGLPNNPNVTTIAGSYNSSGYADGAPTATARFKAVYDIAVDANEANLYVADGGNYLIRRIPLDASGNAGNVVTIAGNTSSQSSAGNQDGQGPGGGSYNALIGSVYSLFVDSTGQYLFMADTTNHVIRRMDLTSGDVETYAGINGTYGSADGIRKLAAFNSPIGVACASDGTVYVGDAYNHRVRKINPSTGFVSHVTGSIFAQPGSLDGKYGQQAVFSSYNATGQLPLNGNNICKIGGDVFVADNKNGLRRIASDGTVSTISTKPMFSVCTDGTNVFTLSANCILKYSGTGWTTESTLSGSYNTSTQTTNTCSSTASSNNYYTAGTKNSMVYSAGKIYVQTHDTFRVVDTSTGSAVQLSYNNTQNDCYGYYSPTASIPTFQSALRGLSFISKNVTAIADVRSVKLWNQATGDISILAGSALSGLQDGAQINLVTPTDNYDTFSNYPAKTTKLPDGRIVSIGGSTDGTNGIKTVKIGTVSGNSTTWVASTDFPEAGVIEHSVATLPDGKIIVLGGYTDSSNKTACGSYIGTVSSDNKITWTSISACPNGTADGLLVVSGSNVVYLSSKSSVIGKYTGSDVSWGSLFSALPNSGGGVTGKSAITLPDGRIFVTGGMYSGNCQSEAYIGVLGSDTINWTSVTNLPYTMAYHKSLVLSNGYVVLVGGQTGNGKASALVFFAIISNNTVSYIQGNNLDTAGIVDSLILLSSSDNRVILLGMGSSTSSYTATSEVGYLSIPPTFTSITGITTDGTNFYVCDSSTVRKITQNGIVTTIAGSVMTGFENGTGANATFSTTLNDIVYSSGANCLYVADAGNNVIRRIDLATGIVSIACGNGQTSMGTGEGINASVGTVMAMAYDATNQDLWFTAYSSGDSNAAVRKYNEATQQVITIAGSGNGSVINGNLLSSRFSSTMNGIIVDSKNKKVYVSDTGNNVVRVIDLGFLPYPQVFSYTGSGVSSQTGHVDYVTATGIGKLCSIDKDKFLAITASSLGLVKYDISKNFVSTIISSFADSYSTSPAKMTSSKTALGSFGLSSGYFSVGLDGNIYAYNRANYTITKYDTTTGEFSQFLGTHGASGSASNCPAYKTTFSETGTYNDSISNIVWEDANTVWFFGQPYVRRISFATDDCQTINSSNSYGSTDGQYGSFTIAHIPGAIYDSNDKLIYFTNSNISTAVTTVRSFDVNSYYVETYAGGTKYSGSGASNDGVRLRPLITYPSYLSLSEDGSKLYIGNWNSGDARMRRLDISTNLVDTVLGDGTSGSNDTYGNFTRVGNGVLTPFYKSGKVYFADYANYKVRVYDETTKLTSVVAGSGYSGYTEGKAAVGMFNYPMGIVVDTNGDIYVADSSNNRIRKISNGQITTFAGKGVAGFADGKPSEAMFNNPNGLAWSSDKSTIYVADTNNNRVRYIDKATGKVGTLFGNGSASTVDGIGDSAAINGPMHMVEFEGNLYVTEYSGHRIRKYGLSDKRVSVFAGDGTKGYIDGTGQANTRFNNPWGICVSNNRELYVAEYSNHVIRRIDIDTCTVLLIAGTPPNNSTSDTTYPGNVDGYNTSTKFNYPRGIVCTADGTSLYVADQSNYKIRRVYPQLNVMVQTWAGTGNSGYADGVNLIARMNNPRQFVLDGNGNMFIADSGNNVIRKMKLSTGFLTTIAGDTSGSSSDGTGWGIASDGPKSKFNYPAGIAFDGNFLYVADYSGYRIRKVNPYNGYTTTIAGSGQGFLDGNGTSASFYNPAKLSLDASKENLYIVDVGYSKIRVMDIQSGLVSTLVNTSGKSNSYGIGNIAQVPLNLTIHSQITWISPTQFLIGNSAYVSKVDISSKTLTMELGVGSYPGNCMGKKATYQSTPIGMTKVGSTWYVSDVTKIKTVDDATGISAYFAGNPFGQSGFVDGSGGLSAALFGSIADIKYSASRNALFILDSQYHKVRKIDLTTGKVSTLAGSNFGIAGYSDDTMKLVYAAGPYGSRLDTFKVRPTSTTGSTVVRFFLNNGGDVKIKENNSMIAEISVPSISTTETGAQSEFFYYPNLSLDSGMRVYATLGTATSYGPNSPIAVTVFGGDY
jgi:sugar lactone lactonase YvrE